MCIFLHVLLFYNFILNVTFILLLREGYWFNIVDMKAFTALRGTSLKSFRIPSCCISIDDQSWPFNLDENLNEVSN